MGPVESLSHRLQSARIIGLDTAIFIYAFERHAEYGPLARTVFRTLEEGRCRGVVSVLALGEVLTGVKKMQNRDLLLRYRDVFQRFPGLTLYPADVLVMERMSDLRVQHGLPTPDAIHLGTAWAHGAGAFVTNDARLRRVTELDVLVLADFLPGVSGA